MLFCCLRHNIEASCHTFRRCLPPSTNSATYQRLVSSTRHGPSQLNVLHLLFQPFTARDGAAPSRDECRCRWGRQKSRFWPGARHWVRIYFCLPHLHLHSTPPLENPRRNIDMTFGKEKLEWRDYQKVKKIEDMFIRFDRMYERDRQTDGHRMTA